MTDPWGNAQSQVPWQCEYCEKPVTLSVLDRWSVIPDDEEGPYFEPFERIAARCDSCKAAYVLGRELPQFPGEEIQIEQLFPMEIAPLGREVPQTIRAVHDEAVRCIRARCWTAAALIARRGIETICAEHGQRTGNLAGKLDSLRDTGVIDDRLHDWSSVVRNLGNAGAHDVETLLSREDADDAIAFFEALVNYLYTFRARYEVHMERKREDGEA